MKKRFFFVILFSCSFFLQDNIPQKYFLLNLRVNPIISKTVYPKIRVTRLNPEQFAPKIDVNEPKKFYNIGSTKVLMVKNLMIQRPTCAKRTKPGRRVLNSRMCHIHCMHYFPIRIENLDKRTIRLSPAKYRPIISSIYRLL